MKDIENAYRILELTVGARFKEVAEAREDLLILWDTEHLAHHPRLRSRSPGKIRQINQAYEILMEHLGRSEVGRGSRPPIPLAPTQRRVRDNPAKTAETAGTDQPSTSLFEEVFSERKSPQARHIPAWLIVVLVTTAALAIGYVAQSSRGEKQLNKQTAGPDPVPKPLETFGSDTPSSIKITTASSGDPNQLSKARAGSAGNQSGKPQSPESQDPTALSPKQTLATRPASSLSKSSPPSVSAPKAKPKKQSAGAKAAAHNSKRPVLVRQKTNFDAQASGVQLEDGQREKDMAKEVQQKEEADTAYRLLMIKSVLAKRLVAEESQLRLVEWKVIKRETPEIWIDIIAKEVDKELRHFIWSVNLKTDTIRPLSEAARNLGRTQ